MKGLRELTLVAAVGCALPWAAAQEPSRGLVINKANRTIAITATERVLTEAEVATVHVGFRLYRPTQEAAYAAGSQASNAIAEALRKAGVPKEAIESESQGVSPTDVGALPDRAGAAERAARAFSVQQSWTVRTAAVDAARVLDVAVEAGANESGQIDWSLKDPNAVQAEAASKAMQRARTQAAAMANGLGVKLGELVYASNQVEGEPVRPLNGRELPVPAPMMKVAAPQPLAINTRRIETAATVYAVFALE